MKKQWIIVCLSGMLTASVQAQQSNYISEVWVADQGNGTYKNPVLFADYSDPDVCRAGDDFYLTSSSFGCLPGLQILHSKDLVNWSIISAAVPTALPPVTTPERPEHGNRVWAPSIRHHNGEFYIFWGDPDQGIFMVKSAKAEGPWSEPVLVKEIKGIIDTCPLWDEDGKVYLAHAYAGSRAGLKSVISVCELNAGATKAIGPSRIIFDGHEAHQTCEGPKLYKKDGYYYIFLPAGGVATGWQVVLRSKNIYGPYESRTVLAQGNTPVNGPHQGGWVDTPTGEDWFMHFQDVGAYGRVVHLQPMKWIDGWPVIGTDKDNDGCGEPVLTYRKPDVGGTYPTCTPQESDEFDGYTLSPPMAMACQHQRQMGLLCRRPEHGTSLLAPRDGRLQKPMGCTQSAVAENPGGQFYGNHETDIQPQSQIQGRAHRAGCHGYGLCRTNHGKYGARPYAFASHLPESG